MHYSKKYADMVDSGLIIYEPETGKFFTKDGKERRMFTRSSWLFTVQR